MIASLTPFTALDFPSKLSCIVWFAGCNLRCQYCYNTEIVECKSYLCTDKVLEFLQSRVGLLDGVVFSGGECTLWGERLFHFARSVKNLGFAIKLDSNATEPKALHKLLKEDLLDYVALDYKAPKEKYSKICGVNKEYNAEFERCVFLLQEFGVKYEIRTTYHSELLEITEIEQMREKLRELGYEGRYYVQGFVGEKKTFGSLGISENGGIKEVWGIKYRG